MADITASGQLVGKVLPARLVPPKAWHAILAAAVVSGVTAGLFAATPAQTALALSLAEPALTTLLRFMAIVKAAMALGFVALTAWRFGYPVSGRLAAAYIAAAALMSAAPVLIWQMAHVVAGAASFHIGLLLFAGAPWTDRDGRSELLAPGGWRR
jgi:hypothetical protein